MIFSLMQKKSAVTPEESTCDSRKSSDRLLFFLRIFLHSELSLFLRMKQPMREKEQKDQMEHQCDKP